jgi:hypothetical protein
LPLTPKSAAALSRAVPASNCGKFSIVDPAWLPLPGSQQPVTVMVLGLWQAVRGLADALQFLANRQAVAVKTIRGYEA